MPPLQVCGRSFLVGADDFVFSVPVDALITLIWAASSSCGVFRLGAWRLNVPEGFLDLDFVLCTVTVVVDVLIFVCAAGGSIMDDVDVKRRNRRCGPLIVFRAVVLGSLLLGNFAISTACILYHVYAVIQAGERLADAHHFRSGTADDLLRQGWGSSKLHIPVFPDVMNVHLPECLFVLFILSRCVVTGFYIVLVFVLLIPKDALSQLASSTVSTYAIQRALRLVGFGRRGKDSLIRMIAATLMEVQGNVSLDMVVPSDLLFGLLVHSASQLQGWLSVLPSEQWSMGTGVANPMSQPLLTNETRAARAEDPQVARVSLATLRASLITGKRYPPRKLDTSCSGDIEAIRDVLHFEPFVRGIYGVGVVILTDAVIPGSSVMTPARLAASLRRHLPRALGGQAGELSEGGVTFGDLPFRLHEHSMRRAVRREHELQFATWENQGPLSAPPFALFVEHETRRMIVTVRGTLDVKDALADMGAQPKFFDPFGEAKGSNDIDSTGLFAHAAMLEVATDLLDRLKQNVAMEEALAPGGCAAGYSIVCVGHSLGAGVACIIALKLWSKFRERVRYIGFEPPGGLLSTRIAKRTAELPGWYATACCHDLVPRLSIRSMQRLREDAIGQLYNCKRSKLQLSMLLLGGGLRYVPLLRCLTGPLGSFVEYLAGGRLRFDTSTTCRSSMNDSFYKELYPGGKLLYFKPVEEEKLLCGLYLRSTAWSAYWIEHEDLDELVLSYRALEMHFPPVIRNAFHCAAEELGLDPDGGAREVPCERLA